MRKTVLGALATLALLASSGVVASAQTADKFKGKTFEIIIGYDTGGGYDIYARALG